MDHVPVQVRMSAGLYYEVWQSLKCLFLQIIEI